MVERVLKFILFIGLVYLVEFGGSFFFQFSEKIEGGIRLGVAIYYDFENWNESSLTDKIQIVDLKENLIDLIDNIESSEPELIVLSFIPDYNDEREILKYKNVIFPDQIGSSSSYYSIGSLLFGIDVDDMFYSEVLEALSVNQRWYHRNPSSIRFARNEEAFVVEDLKGGFRGMIVIVNQGTGSEDDFIASPVGDILISTFLANVFTSLVNFGLEIGSVYFDLMVLLLLFAFHLNLGTRNRVVLLVLFFIECFFLIVSQVTLFAMLNFWLSPSVLICGALVGFVFSIGRGSTPP